ncbi:MULTISPECIES: DUF3048 domain-containing protein [Cryobacterium]|uniref:DUF3048 domain-containing protein n=1 Tax=Cryobacterium breve TaxID=1259258 RepID=A0ABY2J9X2_9MICO|nr:MULTISPECIES: DUF3048 domain-containing protein [Cryobacterium]TFC96288.1 DUF3048 domain-containing protein [Cryobacterium sp. TmT3-12]TFD00707.1 DUF3048 domain-containing protein [Cryobacterium breve]
MTSKHVAARIVIHPQRRRAAPASRYLRMLGAVLLPSLMLLTACAGGDDAPTSSGSAGGLPWDSTYDAPAATDVAPLRGTSVAVGSLAHPALAAKIDNHEQARPQLALERTDLVFEELVEGGLTRYVAVWQSDIPDLVGPVRSIRPMDPDIVAPFGGIVAYSGGQQQFIDMMRATTVLNAAFDNDDTGLFARADDRDAPHDVILEASELVERNSTLLPPPQQFSYAATAQGSSAAVDGNPVSAIDSTFSTSRWPSWTWDAPSAVFLRSQEGAPDLDSTGAQLRATNVVVLRVAIDDTYPDVPKTTMIGSGEAWVASGGKSLHAVWSKADQTAPIRLVDDFGVTIRLAAGNTWIELVPTDRGSVVLVP